jgi:hypothetical protein
MAGKNDLSRHARGQKRSEIDISDDTDQESVDDNDATISPKKNKNYLQTYRPAYSNIKGIQASQKSVFHAYCTYCKTDFSIRHSGRYDITRHQNENKTHKKMVVAAKGNQAVLTGFMPQRVDETQQKVLRAETMYTDLIIELNLPLSVADKFNKVHKKAFPDSEIAKKYQCGRDKTTAIAKFLGKEEANDVILQMKLGPFSIATDGGSDVKMKQYPLVVTTSDLETGVKPRLLGVPCLPLDERSTGTCRP